MGLGNDEKCWVTLGRDKEWGLRQVVRKRRELGRQRTLYQAAVLARRRHGRRAFKALNRFRDFSDNLPGPR